MDRNLSGRAQLRTQCPPDQLLPDAPDAEARRPHRGSPRRMARAGSCRTPAARSRARPGGRSRPRRCRAFPCGVGSSSRGPLLPAAIASPNTMALVLTEDRGAVRHLVLNRPEKRNALNGEAIRELGARDRGRRGRRLGPGGGGARRGPDVLVRHGPERPARAVGEPREPARVPAADPELVEPARGDAEADDLPDPRRGARRRVRAGARLRLPHHGRGRGGRDHGGAGGAAARRGRLLAPAGGRRARQRQGADHDRQGHRRPRGAPDRVREPDRAGGRARRGHRRASRTSCSRARRAPSGWRSA